MAWTAPATWVDGALIAATDLNTHVRDNLLYLKGQAGVVFIENAIELSEQAVPATPAAAKGRVYIGNASPNNGIASCVDDGGIVYQMVRYVGGARVYNNANITMTTGVAAALTFNTERYDDSAFHSTSVNTSRMTIPVAGKYLIGGTVRFAANTTGQRNIYLQVNGATIIASVDLDATAALTFDIDIVTAYSFAAADYIELFAFQNSGGNLNVTSAGNLSPEFWVHYLDA